MARHDLEILHIEEEEAVALEHHNSLGCAYSSPSVAHESEVTGEELAKTYGFRVRPAGVVVVSAIRKRFVPSVYHNFPRVCLGAAAHRAERAFAVPMQVCGVNANLRHV